MNWPTSDSKGAGHTAAHRSRGVARAGLQAADTSLVDTTGFGEVLALLQARAAPARRCHDRLVE